MMSRDSEKLDAILARLDKLDSLEDKIDNISTKLNTLTAEVDSLKTKVNSNTTDITDMKEELTKVQTEMNLYKQEVWKLKSTNNAREQRLRASTVRIFNIPVNAGESLENFKPLSTKVYDRILRPALVAAKTAGDIGTVPQIQTAVEACFRAFTQTDPAASTLTPPPVIVRLSTTTLKWAVMKHRRNIPPPPDSEKDAGIRRYVLVEDLTPDAHKLLKQLQADSRTDKVWSVNGQIFFSRPGVSGATKVKSVFSTLETILG